MINESALGSTSSGSIDSLKLGAQNPQQPFPSFPLLLEPLAPALTAVSPFLSRSQDMAFSSHEVALWERERNCWPTLQIYSSFPNIPLTRCYTDLSQRWAPEARLPKWLLAQLAQECGSLSSNRLPEFRPPAPAGFGYWRSKPRLRQWYYMILTCLFWAGREGIMSCSQLWALAVLLFGRSCQT